VKPTQGELDAYNNVPIDPHIHDELLAVRQIDTRPVTQPLEQQTDPTVTGIRQRAMEHQQASVTQQLQYHPGTLMRHHSTMEKQKRFVTQKLSLDEATHELPAMPTNPRFNAMMYDDSWLNDRKIS
jgi:hypothetical protein